jgi:3-hydroxy-3-methylglutaryl CoA synthase
MGGTYAGSVFVSLLGWAAARGAPIAGERVGIYSYGSGSTGEFYSGVYGDGADAVARDAAPAAQLDARLAITVAEYEAAERARLDAIDVGDFEVSLEGFRELYASAYAGTGRLTFRGAKDFVRRYEWS